MINDVTLTLAGKTSAVRKDYPLFGKMLSILSSETSQSTDACLVEAFDPLPG